MNKTLLTGAAFALTLGFVVAGVLLTRPAREPHEPASARNLDRDDPAGLKDAAGNQGADKSPSEIADAEYESLKDPKRRVELIEWVAGQSWAGHKTPMLRKALVADPDEAVQLAALRSSIKLAEKSSQGSIAEVLRTGLGAANARVVQQSLREARKHPSIELVPDLIEIANSTAAHRFLAIDALAFTDDPKAKAKVVEWAGREDGDNVERIRAVALLSKVKCPESEALLARLCGSSDEEVRKVAVEALAAYGAK